MYLILKNLDFKVSKNHKEIRCRSYKTLLNQNCFLSSFETLVLDENVDVGEKTFFAICNEHAPCRNSKIKGNSHPRIFNDIILLMKKRDKRHWQVTSDPVLC